MEIKQIFKDVLERNTIIVYNTHAIIEITDMDDTFEYYYGILMCTFDRLLTDDQLLQEVIALYEDKPSPNNMNWERWI